APEPDGAPAADLQPCDTGRTWTYDARFGPGEPALRTTFVLLARERRFFPGWDRALPTPNLYLSFDGGATHLDKGLLPEVDGVLHLAREGLHRASWEYAPPIPLFGGAEAVPGASWKWSGRLRLRGEAGEYDGPSTALGRVEAREEVEVPAGVFPCWRTRVVHGEPPLEVLRWHAPGIGLVKERASLGGRVVYEADLLSFSLPGAGGDRNGAGP
ncbi:MAG: hypothetical protein HUU06_05040, partial [Planctomycetaceae bacterium]|nr:hypothetical protein [Planctomycetaceae bacterium]